jgi:DnaJ-class molecular chaperone
MQETKLTDAKPSDWRKDWTPEERAELYNGGDGRPYEDAKPSGETCKACGGTGNQMMWSYLKDFHTAACPKCNGTGRDDRREVKR